MNDTINNGGVGPLVGDVRVGPIDTPNGTSYVYRIGDRISEYYANAESARYFSTKPQRVNERGRLEPLS
jgi:hypothetical protein